MIYRTGIVSFLFYGLLAALLWSLVFLYMDRDPYISHRDYTGNIDRPVWQVAQKKGTDIQPAHKNKASKITQWVDEVNASYQEWLIARCFPEES